MCTCTRGRMYIGCLGVYERCMRDVWRCMGDVWDVGGDKWQDVLRVYGGVWGIMEGCMRNVWGTYACNVHILIKGSRTFLIAEGNVFRFLQCFCSLSINLSYVG